MRRIFSIARLTVANAVRMKIAIIIIVFLCILIPSLPFVLKTDDTQLGHVQITLTYALGMVFFLLSVMTVFIGAASISNELAGGQMQLLGTKPVSRWQVLLGKWLGIMLLNLVLVIFLGGVTFGLARFIGRASRGSANDQMLLQNSVFIARVTIKPELPEGVDHAVDAEYSARIKENRIPDEYRNPDGSVKEREYREVLRDQELKQRGVVASGTERVWTFKGIKINEQDRAGIITIRYKAQTTETRADRLFAGRWYFGGIYEPPGGKKPIEKWGFLPIEETAGSFHELSVPAFVVKPDGTLDVKFANDTVSDYGTERGISASFNPDDGLELLYKRSGFLTNYIRYFLLIMAILGFMAMLSVVSSSFLSFPVAALFTFSIVLNSYGLAAFKEFAYSKNPMDPDTTGVVIGKTAAKVVHYVISNAIPDLSKYSMLSMLNSGRYIPTALVLHSFLFLTIIFGGIIYTLGCVIFTHKELG
jgi:hypothetical protein